MNKNEAVLNFWNDRAHLKDRAGTNDLIAKQLEIEAIAKYVRDGMNILEVGCGNGITAIELARRYDVDITAIDYAEEMIAEAQELHLDTTTNLKGGLSFETGDVRELLAYDIDAQFDLIYTERVLINLPDWPAQRDAIYNICSLLKPGGAYIMCENSQDGVDQLNKLRALHSLPMITPPWHNRYLRDEELKNINPMEMAGMLEKIDYYSSTYYFLSRIVNAIIAAQEGKEPDYNSPINRLALTLPPIGKLGQGRIWVWRKA